jgi:hypothetical protein
VTRENRLGVTPVSLETVRAAAVITEVDDPPAAVTQTCEKALLVLLPPTAQHLEAGVVVSGRLGPAERATAREKREVGARQEVAEIRGGEDQCPVERLHPASVVAALTLV